MDSVVHAAQSATPAAKRPLHDLTYGKSNSMHFLQILKKELETSGSALNAPISLSPNDPFSDSWKDADLAAKAFRQTVRDQVSAIRKGESVTFTFEVDGKEGILTIQEESGSLKLSAEGLFNRSSILLGTTEEILQRYA